MTTPDTPMDEQSRDGLLAELVKAARMREAAARLGSDDVRFAQANLDKRLEKVRIALSRPSLEPSDAMIERALGELPYATRRRLTRSQVRRMFAALQHGEGQ